MQVITARVANRDDPPHALPVPWGLRVTGDSLSDVGSIDGPRAQRDVLVEVLGILCHDLNNPLQSLVVLLELGVDEAPEGSDTRARAEQCQAAAERIRVLTAALTGLLRELPEDGPRVWARVEALLRRRFERSSVTLAVDVRMLDGVPLPSGMCMVLCAVGLLVLASVSSADHGVVLSVRGHDTPTRRGLELEVRTTGDAPVRWNEAAAARLLAMAAADPRLVVTLHEGRVQVDVAAKVQVP